MSVGNRARSAACRIGEVREAVAVELVLLVKVSLLARVRRLRRRKKQGEERHTSRAQQPWRYFAHVPLSTQICLLTRPPERIERSQHS
jgi:hypothetical protein